VRDVAVTLEPGKAKIEFDELASTEQLQAAVQQAGYEVDDSGGSRQAKAGCCS
jgi:copper chaperone CopZ